MRAAILILTLAMVACTASPPPESTVKTQIVEKAVPVPCQAKLDPRPALMDKTQLKAALAAAASVDDEAKIIMNQLLLYMGWTPQVEAGLAGCQGAKTAASQ